MTRVLPLALCVVILLCGCSSKGPFGEPTSIDSTFATYRNQETPEYSQPIFDWASKEDIQNLYAKVQIAFSEYQGIELNEYSEKDVIIFNAGDTQVRYTRNRADGSYIVDVYAIRTMSLVEVKESSYSGYASIVKSVTGLQVDRRKIGDWLEQCNTLFKGDGVIMIYYNNGYKMSVSKAQNNDSTMWTVNVSKTGGG